MTRPRDLDTATRTTSDTTTASGPDPGDGLRMPGLVIAAHPDPDRIGEVAVLADVTAGRAAPLSRHLPLFQAPRGGEARPLADAHVSRSPIALEPGPAAGGVTVDAGGCRAAVTVAGERIAGARTFSPAEIERGVVLVLGRRVALLLYPLDPLPPRPAPDFGLVGDSAAVAALRREIQAAARLDLPVLLRGETGTGKELVARALHENGRRASGPYLAVDMGALVPALAAAELFGSARGAYTGADKARRGFFRSADGGDLFLDEIGEAPPEVQALLLRALESHEVQPVGSVETHRVDVRVIAATDADLALETGDGRFRPALLHRLAGYEIFVPPLRARRDDVPRLLRHFLVSELEKVGEGLERWPSAEASARLVDFDWPGNVRQLRNVARRLAVADAATVVEALVENGPAPGDAQRTSPSLPASPVSAPPAPSRRRYRKPSDVDDAELLAALEEHSWKVQPAAAALGVSRTTLYRLIEASPGIRKAGDLTTPEIDEALERCGGDARAAARELRVSYPGLERRLAAAGPGRG